MARNDRACCECQGTPTCCTACSNCLITGSYADVGFEIDPAILGCSTYVERICDPNCIPDFSQLDPAYIQRKTSGCQQEKFTTSVQYATNESCCRYYEGDDGSCGCGVYSQNFYDSWLNDSICPQPIGNGVMKATYRQVSGIARVHVKRSTLCLEDIDVSPVTSNAQFSTCIEGSDNYLRPSGSNQTCNNSDAPSDCGGLSGSPTCKVFNWDFGCALCPFCPPFPIKNGTPFVIIRGTIDVIRDYEWLTEPLNGSSSCYPDPPSSHTTEFQFTSYMQGEIQGGSVTYTQAWSSLRATPTHSGELLGIGVEFDNFTI